MQKRGQVEISFGMIFSIILIIVFLAVGFYAIKLFLHTSDEAKAGTLISDLQTDIDNVWRNPSSSVTKDYSMPSNADYICFVNFSYDDSGANSVFYQNIKDSGIDYTERNFVFYPVNLGNLGSTEIKHINWETTISNDNPLCIKSANGKVSILLQKDYGEILVTISKP